MRSFSAGDISRYLRTWTRSAATLVSGLWVRYRLIASASSVLASDDVPNRAAAKRRIRWRFRLIPSQANENTALSLDSLSQKRGGSIREHHEQAVLRGDALAPRARWTLRVNCAAAFAACGGGRVLVAAAAQFHCVEFRSNAVKSRCGR